MKKEIDPKWSPRKVDSFLQKNYSLSLYHFAYSINDLFSQKDYRSIRIKESPHLELPWRDFWVERVQDLKKLKKYNQESRKILDKFFYKTDLYLKSFFACVWQELGPEKNLVINDIYHPINELIEHIEEYFLALTKKRGV